MYIYYIEKDVEALVVQLQRLLELFLLEVHAGPAFVLRLTRKVDVRLLGKGNSNSHGARPVHLIITMTDQ